MTERHGPSPAAADAAKDDPIGLRSPLMVWAFTWYLRWFFWRNFHAIRVARDGLPQAPPDRPLLIYCNHPSWWDPALCFMISDILLPRRPGFGPMDAAALDCYRLFRRMGVFGITLASAQGAARFLAIGLRILANPAHVLYVTAEGHFTDARTRPVRLRPGIAHIARRVPEAVILPLAIEYTFWNERQPEALLRFGAPVQPPDQPASVAAWTALLEQRLTETMDALAEAAISRETARFRPLLRGRAGVGGIYDVWRRLAGMATLRPVQLAHDPLEHDE